MLAIGAIAVRERGNGASLPTGPRFSHHGHAAAFLGRWLKEAQESGIPELGSLAAGIYRDYDAVYGALETSYSNGQTEAQVHRLKLIKRQAYGRASFDQLRLRVLHGAGVTHQEKLRVEHSYQKVHVIHIIHILYNNTPNFTLRSSTPIRSNKLVHDALCQGSNRQRGIGAARRTRYQGPIDHIEVLISENSPIQITGFAKDHCPKRMNGQPCLDL
jgi:hypothetical protein